MADATNILAAEQFLEDCRSLDGEAARRVFAALSELQQKHFALAKTAKNKRSKKAEVTQQNIDQNLLLGYRYEGDMLVAVELQETSARPQTKNTSSRLYEVSQSQLQRLLHRELSHRAHWELLKLVLYLTPEQRSIVGLPGDGHRWIKGASGSGKTTVAVRRAIHLARQGMLHGQPHVLLVLPSQELCSSLRKAVDTVAPEVSASITLTTMTLLCREHLQQHLPHVRVMTKDTFHGLVEQAIGLTQKERNHPVLQRSTHFFCKELDEIIFDHDIHHLNRYLQFPREGQRQRLDVKAREVLWRVNEHFQSLRLVHGSLPYPQAVKRLAQVSAQNTEVAYDHVVLDEAQTMRTVELSFCHALAAQGSLTVFSDVETRPGFHWREVGLSFVGRTHSLPQNRRNNHHILDYARQVLRCTDTTSREGVKPDITPTPLLWPDETDEQPPLPFAGHLTGPRPRLLVCSGWREELGVVVEKIEEMLQGGRRLSEIAVLTRHRHYLERLATIFIAKGLPHVLPDPENFELEDLLSAEAVRLLPLDRAVGLEFPVVFLADANDGAFPLRARAGAAPEDREMDFEEARRCLYLGMTRAMQELWIVCTGRSMSPLLPQKGLEARSALA